MLLIVKLPYAPLRLLSGASMALLRELDMCPLGFQKYNSAQPTSEKSQGR